MSSSQYPHLPDTAQVGNRLRQSRLYDQIHPLSPFYHTSGGMTSDINQPVNPLPRQSRLPRSTSTTGTAHTHAPGFVIMPQTPERRRVLPEYNPVSPADSSTFGPYSPIMTNPGQQEFREQFWSQAQHFLNKIPEEPSEIDAGPSRAKGKEREYTSPAHSQHSGITRQYSEAMRTPPPPLGHYPLSQSVPEPLIEAHILSPQLRTETEFPSDLPSGGFPYGGIPVRRQNYASGPAQSSGDPDPEPSGDGGPPRDPGQSPTGGPGGDPDDPGNGNGGNGGNGNGGNPGGNPNPGGNGGGGNPGGHPGNPGGNPFPGGGGGGGGNPGGNP